VFHLSSNKGFVVTHSSGLVKVKFEKKVDFNAIRQLEFSSRLMYEPKPIKTIGLLQWKIEDSLHLDEDQRGFSVAHRYIPVERRPQEFQDFLAKFISIIEGPYPESGPQCDNCKFLGKIGFSF